MGSAAAYESRRTMPHEGLELDSAAIGLYADLRLGPFLRQLLARSSNLVGAAASSLSLIDARQNTYIKMAEHGASCQLGQSFPLDEGVTGQVFARRQPVMLGSYHDVPHGHLPGSHPARHGAVAAIPIWWRGEVIGANVLFSGDERRFTVDEVDELELLTQLAAAGIVRAGVADPSLAHLIPAQTVTTRTPDSLRVAAPPVVVERPRNAPGPFTPREQDVLRLLASGVSDKEVAQALVISTKTVEKHVGAVLRKTGTASRTAAVMRALDRGWVPGTPSPA